VEHEIYNDLLYARVSDGGYFYYGWIKLPAGVRYGLRAELLSSSRSWGVFASYTARHTEMQSGGAHAGRAFRLYQDAEMQVLSIGAARQVALGARGGALPAPELRVGLAALVWHVRAEREWPPSAWIELADFVSPGGQLSVGVVQRVGRRFDLRVQAGYAMLRHDTENLDRGGRPDSDKRFGRWAPAIDIGAGMGVRF
jgi:hypothetical protein